MLNSNCYVFPLICLQWTFLLNFVFDPLSSLTKQTLIFFVRATEEPSKNTIATAILTIKKVSAKDFQEKFKCFGEGYYYVTKNATLTLKRKGQSQGHWLFFSLANKNVCWLLAKHGNVILHYNFVFPRIHNSTCHWRSMHVIRWCFCRCFGQILCHWLSPVLQTLLPTKQ